MLQYHMSSSLFSQAALPSPTPVIILCPSSDFMKEYQLDCPYATDRLVKYGVPATVLHRQVDERDQIGRARQAAETVSMPHVYVQSSPPDVSFVRKSSELACMMSV